MSRNLAASIRARLKQHADERKQDFNLTLTQYGLERLLYRLSVSRHASSYLLKGALLFSLWYDQPHRPTRDADLLGFGPDDIDTAVLQVDIGFGDAVTPAPESVSYPVMLAELPAPQLRSYPKYTVVAEKFHAICLLGMANTRMKDYFDLLILLSEGDLDATQLHRAVGATFERRRMAMPASLPSGLSDAFAQDAAKQRQWIAFLKKNRLDALDLAEVVSLLRTQFENFQRQAADALTPRLALSAD